MRNGRLARIGWLARTGRLARFARRLGLGRSPLRRRTDRIEVGVGGMLLALFLISAPLCWSAVGHWTYQGGLREQRAQQGWHQTEAVLLRAAPPLPSYEYRLAWENMVPVPARWLTPGGQDRTGMISVMPGSHAGQLVAVWVDSSGRATAPPLVGDELTRRVVGMEVLAPVALAVFLFGVACVVRLMLNRRRLRDWETGWAAIGPRWTRHR